MKHRTRCARWLAPLALTACAEAPSYLRTHGYAGDREAELGWILLLVALAVVVVVAGLVLMGSLRGHRPDMKGALVRPTGAGLGWIVIGGIAIPSAVLVVLFVYSMSVLTAVAAPSAPSALGVRIIGHRWWWEV